MKLLVFSILMIFHGFSLAGYTFPPSKLPFGKLTIHYHLKIPSQLETPTRTNEKTNIEEPLVVLLGGGPGFSSWNLQPIQTRLADYGYQVLLMDMAGIGQNRHLIEDIENTDILALWNQQIHQVLKQVIYKTSGKDSVNTEKLNAFKRSVILVGHSWGALMAMLYQRQYPNAIEKIILINPVDPEKKAMQHLTTEIAIRNVEEQKIDWDDESHWQQNTAVGLNDVKRITLRQIQQVLPTYFLDYEQGKQYASQFSIEDFNIDLNVQAWKQYDQDPVRYSHLKKLQLPFYFLECKQDYLMPYNLNAMSAEIEFEQVALLDGCGHFPWIEQSSAFYQTLKTMLDDE